MIDAKAYRENGFILINNFLDPLLVSRILIEAKSIFLFQFLKKGYTSERNLNNLSETLFNSMMKTLFVEDMTTFTNCGKQVQHLISLHRLSLQPEIIDALIKLGVHVPNISTRPVLFFNHPDLSIKKVFYKVDAHQDWRSMQGSLNSVVVWIPLTDIDKNLGALEVLPGSHKLGLVTEHMDTGFGMVNISAEMERKFVPVEVKAGDALFFSSFLIHRSGENITERPRWSCHFRYNDLSEPTFIDRGFAHPYIYKPQDDLITKDFPSQKDIASIFD